MEKSDLIKESIKSLLSMMILILIFVIAIFAVYFSSLLVGQQEELRTAGGEDLYVTVTNGDSSGSDSTIVVENSDELKVKQITPLSPTEGLK